MNATNAIATATTIANPISITTDSQNTISNNIISLQDANGCRFEILPGLWVRLRGEDILTDSNSDDDGGDCSAFNFVVLADDIVIGDFFLMGRNLRVQGQGRRYGSDKWEIVIHNLIVSLESLTLDLLADRNRVLEFIHKFGQAQVPQSDDDIHIPFAKVLAFGCKLSQNISLSFPDCEGSSECTLRLILEYYCRSILNGMDSQSESERKSKIGMKSSTADIASVSVGFVGAAAGAVLLGPVGLVAGSYCGSSFGRKYSRSIVGATAGAALFGPVGMIAGVAGAQASKSKGEEKSGQDAQNMISKSSLSSPESNKSCAVVTTKGAACKVEMENQPSKTSDYAGTVGVCIGSTAGAIALGPLGLLAGAYLGSMSGRALVDRADKKKNSKPPPQADYESCKEGKRLSVSNFTRHIVNRAGGGRGKTNEKTYEFEEHS